MRFLVCVTLLGHSTVHGAHGDLPVATTLA
jgi:hypothetical protein